MNKPIVLQLNANWMPIGQKTVKQAIIAMTSGGNSPPALALDIAYELNEHGEYDFSTPSYINPVGWNEWMTLEVRDYDFGISTIHSKIRVPTVLIAPSYRHVPSRTPRSTKYNVFNRDNGICQYTGKYVSRGKGNVDHILPVSRGGKNVWSNMVWCDATVNSKKGSKLPHEAGLRLIKKPREPIATPITVLMSDANHPSWTPFLINR